MQKTKVDDMLIEMISPKVKQIEEKFTNGKGLSQDDTNTLLLKAQFNHINHLDIKLDETVSNVASLRDYLEFLTKDFEYLRKDFESFKNEINAKFDLFEDKIEHSIQKALNKNMLLLISVMGGFLVLSKLIDKINF